jgi:hypothetical protein
VAYMFLIGLVILFWAFAFGCTYYLVKNDFASETLEVVFPAVGAVLLSTYLGFKSVVVSSPDVKKFGASVAVLHDRESCKVSGMPPRSIKHLQRFQEYRGAELIDELQLDNSFQGLDMPSILRGAHDKPRGPSEIFIEHLLEYAVLEWLTNSDMLVGYEPSRTTQLIHAVGAGGRTPADLAQVPTNNGANEINPFMKIKEVKLMLPKG